MSSVRSWWALPIFLLVYVGHSEQLSERPCSQLGLSVPCEYRLDSNSVECSDSATALRTLVILKQGPCYVDEFVCVDCNLSGSIEVPKASRVNISRNQITNLAIDPSEPLSNLDASNNLLQSISFVNNLPKLKHLRASGNQLQKLSRIEGPLLRSLDLSFNQIDSIDADSFADLPNLTHLHLDGNQIAAVEAAWFDDLENLSVLTLSSNRIRSLTSLVFSSLRRLERLNLSRNGLVQLSMLSFQGLGSVKELDVSWNDLRTLPNEFGHGLRALERLDVSANPMSSLSSLRSMSAVRFELVARNLSLLEEVNPKDFEGLRDLRSLDLSGSGLRSIALESFANMSNLTNLNLSNCSLTTLPSGLFASLHSLKVIDLSGNRWLCDCRLKWLPYFLLHRPHLQVEGVASTSCANGQSLLDSLDGLTCENATIYNHTRRAQFPLRSTAKLFCEYRGVPTPTLTWHSNKFGGQPPKTCQSSCYDDGCLECTLNSLICDTEEREAKQRCLKGVEAERREGRCCSTSAVRPAVESCFKLGQGTMERAHEVALCLDRVENIVGVGGRSPGIQTCQAEWTFCGEKDVGDEGADHEIWCRELAVNCSIEVLSGRGVDVDYALCQDKYCTKRNQLYISDIGRRDTGFYTCRAENDLSSQEVEIHVTLDYSFMIEAKNYSILTGIALAALFSLATLIGVVVEKILGYFGLRCPCDADGPIRRRNIVKILEQVEGYRRQNLDRLRENYNWQVARIKENCVLQMDRVKDCYIAEQTNKIKDYGSSQIGAIKDNYGDQVQRVREYGNAQMDWLRESYVFQRNRIHKFSKHQLIKLRENYKMQQKHLNKILETLPNLESCRRGYYSEGDLTDLGLSCILAAPPPAPESVIEFPPFDEFSLPDVRDVFETRSGSLCSADGTVATVPGKPHKVYPAIEQVIRERLLPNPQNPSPNSKKKGHTRSHSAPIAAHVPCAELRIPPMDPNVLQTDLSDTPASSSGTPSTARASDVLVDIEPSTSLQTDI